MHISDMVMVAGWMTTSSLPGGVAPLPPRRRDSPEALVDFRFLVWLAAAGPAAVVTSPAKEDEIEVGSLGSSGTGPAERRCRSVVGTVAATTGVA